MKRIAILSSSVRTGRLSHRVALYLQHYLTANELAETEILDLKAYDFPLFEERFAFLPNPSGKVIDFTERLVAADALIIVTPVYNASFSAALKNVIDLYLQEWRRQPVAVVSVTSGKVTVQQLQALLLKLGALVVPMLCTVISAGETFDEKGTAASPAATEKLLRPMIDELLWLTGKTGE